MMTIREMEAIQAEKLKESEKGNPTLDAEGTVIASGKRQSIDQPPLFHKVDPLR